MLSDTALRDIAGRKHLERHGYTLATVPSWYLELLKKHAAVYKDDLNFRVQLQPGSGFGSIFCMESGCQKTIALDRRAALADGGYSQGLGSFHKYQLHTRQDPAHGKSRLRRVERERMERLNPPSRATDSTAAKPRASSGSLLKALGASSPARSSQVPKDPPSVNPIARLTASTNTPKNATPNKAKRSSLPGLSSSELFGTPKKKLDVSSSGGASSSDAVHERQAVPASGLNRTPPSLSRRKRPSSGMGYLADTTAASAKLEPGDLVPPAKKFKGSPLAASPRHLIKVEKPVEAEPMPDISAVSRSKSLHKSNENSPSIHPSPSSHRVVSAHVKPVVPSILTRPPLPASSAGFDPIATAMNALSQANGDYAGQEKDIAGLWMPRPVIDIPRTSLNDVLMDLAGSTFDENVTIDGALAKLGLPNAHTRLPGMSSVLLPHQILGVAWMLARERHRDHGGILADEMGLGNVQMIATMMQNRPKNDDPKTTLILCPTALLCQWKAEIETHTDGEPLKVLIYHGAARKKHTTIVSLQKYDVVLTTYATRALEKPTPENLKMKAKKKRPSKDNFIESDSEDESAEDDKPAKSKKDGPLIGFHWYRIVLDEAQMIRTRRTRTSQVVTELWADHRWCLTGTPIINTLEDAYPFFAFLGIRPWNDWTEFRMHIIRDMNKNPKTSTARLQAIWRTVMLRRKKDSKLDGEPLVRLPPKTVSDIELQFSLEERQTYDAICARAQAVFNRYVRSGTVLKNYHHVFAMLLRLRQICVHPCLIAENADAFRTEDELEGIKEREALNEVLGRARRECGQSFVDKMLVKRKDIMDSRIAAEKESPDASTELEECPACKEPLMAETAYATECCHSLCDECLDHVMQKPHVVDINEKDKYEVHQRPCPVCRGPISKDRAYLEAAFDPDEPTIIQDSDDEDVKSIVRPKKGRASKGKAKAKIEEVDEPEDVKPTLVRKEEEMDWAAEDAPKPLGRRATLPRGAKAKAMSKVLARDSDSDDSIDDFIVYSDEDEDEDDKDRAKKAKANARSRRVKAKRKDDEVFESEDEESADEDESVDRKGFLGMREIDESILKKPMPKPLGRFLPSAKMLKMMELLKQWREEFPKDKCMIISQWTSVLELCRAYLDENEFKHLSFTGGMSLRQRDDVVQKFKNDKDITIMLMSMKAGGVGLNLTVANRVILLDLGWSPAVESQAFDRVHRLGQQKDVEVFRLVVVETVEARVLDLQKKKQGLMDGSLGEGTVRRQTRLSVRELAALFGINM